MVILNKQKDFRNIRNLSFCYLCGYEFEELGKKPNKDHVPPENLFKKSDRNFPLILHSHEKCNFEESPNDEIIGGIVSLLHGKHLKQHLTKRYIKIGQIKKSNKTQYIPFVSGPDLKALIFRWVRGFHAALYSEFLPKDTFRAIHPPLPTCEENKDNQVVWHEILPQESMIAEVLKKNTLTNLLDKIECNNGKLNYKCVWRTSDNGKTACFFALNVYDWINLGTYPKGCIGLYAPKAGKPISGTIMPE